MAPITEEDYNRLRWKEIDGRELEGEIEGLTVEGAEPIGYPTTSGFLLYLKDSKDNITVLEIEADIFEEVNNYINVQIATAPKFKQKGKD